MWNLSSRKMTMVATIAIVAALGLAFGTSWAPHSSRISGAAWAAGTDTHSDGPDTGGDHQGGPQKGKGGQHDQGGHDGQRGESDHGSGGGVAIQGGAAGHGKGKAGADSDGRGPNAGAAAGSRGTKPVWSREGIPSVELGRLNVSRSPSHVLQRAYEEALATMSPEMVSFYNLPLDQVIDRLSLNYDNVARIDSPLQNLALLKDTLNGSPALSSIGVTNDPKTLEAIFLGNASDKTIPITPETVIAVTTILGTPVTGSDAEKLAAEAEAVRIAVLAGHDS